MESGATGWDYYFPLVFQNLLEWREVEWKIGRDYFPLVFQNLLDRREVEQKIGRNSVIRNCRTCNKPTWISKVHKSICLVTMVEEFLMSVKSAFGTRI